MERIVAHAWCVVDRRVLYSITVAAPLRHGYHRSMDVSQASFQSAVIERSHHVPVVVDFWAEWCGPCRQLGPLLERAVEARAGKVELAKVNTDLESTLAQTYGIQGIPAVKAFRDGQVVN